MAREIFFPLSFYEQKPLPGFLSSSNASCVQWRY